MTGNVAGCMFAITAVVGMLSNLLLLWIIPYSSALRSTAATLLLNLAVADLVFCVLDCGSTAVYAAVHYWPFGAALCKIVSYVSSVCQYVAAYTLLLVCIERFHAVRSPVPAGAGAVSKGRYMGCVTLIWAASCAISIYMFSITEYNVKDFSYNRDTQPAVGPFAFTDTGSWTYATRKEGICWLTQDTVKRDIHTICTFVLQYALPALGSLALIIAATCCGPKQPAETSRQPDHEMTLVVMLTVILHILLWVPPYFIGFSLMQLPEWLLLLPLDVAKNIIFVSGWLAYCAASLRPLVYAIVSNKFRREYRRVLCCEGPNPDAYGPYQDVSQQETPALQLQGTSSSEDQALD